MIALSPPLVGLILTAGIAVPTAALVMQHTLHDESRNRVRLTSSSGALKITNSREGQAILTAVPMVPGGTATGTVDLENSGDRAEELTLDAEEAVDTPGPGGGRLSERLLLDVEDVTVADALKAVYSGGLTGFERTDLGTLAKGADRTYRFVVTFADGGPNGADNAFQGSSASIGFEWTVATAAASACDRAKAQARAKAKARARAKARAKAKAKAKAKAFAHAKRKAQARARARAKRKARARARARSKARAKAEHATFAACRGAVK